MATTSSSVKKLLTFKNGNFSKQIKMEGAIELSRMGVMEKQLSL